MELGFDVFELVEDVERKQAEIEQAQESNYNTRIWWQKTNGTTYFALMPFRPIEVDSYFKNNLTERPSTSYLIVAKILRGEKDGEVQDISDYENSYALIQVNYTVYNQFVQTLASAMTESEFSASKQVQVIPDKDDIYPMMFSKTAVGRSNGKNTYSYTMQVVEKPMKDETVDKLLEFIVDNEFDPQEAVANLNTFGIYMAGTDISKIVAEKQQHEEDSTTSASSSYNLADEPDF